MNWTVGQQAGPHRPVWWRDVGSLFWICVITLLVLGLVIAIARKT